MSEISRVNLRKVVPEANMFKQYSVTVGRDLFGQPGVVCAWGRIGTRGQKRQHTCETSEEAEALAQKIILRQLQRGYVAVASGQQAEAGAVRALQTLSPAAAAVLPQRPRRRRKNPAQLCLLTWLETVPAAPTIVPAEASRKLDRMHPTRTFAVPIAAQRALMAVTTRAETFKLLLLRDGTADTLPRPVMLGFAAGNSHPQGTAKAWMRR